MTNQNVKITLGIQASRLPSPAGEANGGQVAFQNLFFMLNINFETLPRPLVLAAGVAGGKGKFPF